MPISSTTVTQIESLVSSETSNVANMANVSAHLMSEGNWHWEGFYTVDFAADELVLRPFQGPVACTRLKRGKGVCAKSCVDNKTVVAPDVHEFEGHVACSAVSNSEVVIPVRNGVKVAAVLDIDSENFDDFSEEEVNLLERVIEQLELRWVE